MQLDKRSKQIDIRPHRRRTRTVKSYSPSGANVHPIYYRKTKNGCHGNVRIGNICTLLAPSIANSLVAIVHTKRVIAILVQKLVAMATTLRHSMDNTNSMTHKSTPGIKQRVASYHTTKVIAHRKPKIGCHGSVHQYIRTSSNT